jgi:DNA recombination protein RmuC
VALTPIELGLLGGIGLCAALLLALLFRRPPPDPALRERESALAARLDEIDDGLARLQGGLGMLSGAQEGRIQSLSQATAASLDAQRAAIDQRLSQTLAESRAGRGELAASFAAFEAKLTQRIGELKADINVQLAAIQADNAGKLEEMRKTVDEKLHATLEQRLGQSFKLVSERLEQVHRGLGEMQNLAAGVGDLKRVLTNVKARGTWGEVQLEAMIEQVLTPEQYQKNVATRPGAGERVEIAIRLPGRDGDAPVWLPIDAKFPVEDYQRLLDAHDRADGEQVEAAARALEARIRSEARTIREKYIEPPHTTDFAILYLPTEGLYAEALRRPGLAESLQRDHRVVISGPNNLAALLNSLQMGFRTLAIEQRSSEVWSLLGAVKTEFGKFGDVIAATQKKLEQATNQFNQVGVRARAIQRKLRDVEALPLSESAPLAALAADEADEEDGDTGPAAGNPD